MTAYNSYVSIPHSSYGEWKLYTLNNQYDVDNFPSEQPYQCWDFTAEFWYNLGYGTGWPHTGPHGAAYECWTVSRNDNAGVQFDLITNLNDVKQGDVMVYDQFTGNEWGHIGFANQDYATWTPDPSQPYEFPILSQNNSANYVNVKGYDTRLFLGAFRLKVWNPSPSPTQENVKRFPWALYANKLRNRNM